MVVVDEVTVGVRKFGNETGFEGKRKLENRNNACKGNITKVQKV